MEEDAVFHLMSISRELINRVFFIMIKLEVAKW